LREFIYELKQASLGENMFLMN